MKLSDKIRAARRLAELSQVELGTSVSLSQRKISAFETDQETPDKNTLSKIAAATGQKLEMFLEEDVQPEPIGKQPVTLAEKIKYARMQANLSQTQMAKRLGVYWQTVSKFETGALSPKPATLFQIASITNKPPAFFDATFADPDKVDKTGMSPGQVLQLYRKANGLTKKELAKATTTPISAIQTWEKDETLPRTPVIKTVAAYLEIDPVLIGLDKAHDFTEPKYKNRSDLIIAQARKDKGLTQLQLAKLIGVSKQAIAQYERTPRELTRKMAAKFAKALDIPEDVFYNIDIKKQDAVCDAVAKYMLVYRLRANMTQEELAHLTGVSAAHISNYERGVRKIAYQSAIKIQHALNIPIEKEDA